MFVLPESSPAPMLTQICNERVGGCWSKGYTYILQTAQDTLDMGLKKAIKVIMEGSGGGRFGK